VTKLDVLDEMEKIPVCMRYRSAGLDVDSMPATIKEMAALEPIYECLPGWQVSTFGVSTYGELPARARDYIEFLEHHTGVEVGCVSTGPERNQTIVKPGSHFARLFQ
jgi:adenylosuccinate synthase